MSPRLPNRIPPSYVVPLLALVALWLHVFTQTAN